ncbi:MAG TPA: glycosyltransferase [Polyangiaceae bacterium]
MPPDSPTAAALVPCPTGELVVGAGEPSSPIRLSLAIPTLNESENVADLVERLVRLLEPELGDAYEIIVIDDDSSDGTWQVALELSVKYPKLRVIRRRGERGLGSAVIRAWQVARGEFLGVMDADLQHPPEANLLLYAGMRRGADLAVASRHVEGGGLSDWSLFRRLASRGAQLLGLLVLPGVLGRITDPMSGYFMVRRSALEGIALRPLGYKILIEVVARARIRWIDEVGYVFRERTDGQSKVTASIYLQYLRHLVRLRLATLPASRFFKFCVVGATGVVVDMTILYLLSDPSTLALGLTRSKLAAAETAIVSNFLLNDAWTFGDVSSRARGLRPKFRRFLGFNAICAAGLVLNVVILNVLFNLAGLDRYLSNAVAIVLVTAWNYFLNRKLNFAPMAPSIRPPPAP